eukprot:m.29859 g.29859  ORF g.29859 m.29859 type:complete len:259 (-) comp16168_c0_seq2:78-854(-)
MGFIQDSAVAQPTKIESIIIPAVSAGNVSQLAADLLIENLSAMRIGYLEHDGLLPMVGQLKRNNGSDELVTSADVYYVEAQSLVIVQQRAPVAKAQRVSFQNMLMEWIKSTTCTRVIILAGMNAFERIESQLHGSQLRSLTSENMASAQDTLTQHGCLPLETRTPTTVVPDGLFVHGGGMCRTLFHNLCATSLETVALLRFCMPGDTRFEAMQLASTLSNWLQLTDTHIGPTGLPKGWALPLSWEKCYGTPLRHPGLF